MNDAVQGTLVQSSSPNLPHLTDVDDDAPWDGIGVDPFPWLAIFPGAEYLESGARRIGVKKSVTASHKLSALSDKARSRGGQCVR